MYRSEVNTMFADGLTPFCARITAGTMVAWIEWSLTWLMPFTVTYPYILRMLDVVSELKLI